MSELSYSVVIVEYFSDELLIGCLESLNEQTLPADKIVVVANGIDDKYVKEIESSHKDVHLIFPNSNLGYSKAANLGTTNIESPVVLVINPDTILEKDCCELAVKHMQSDPSIAAIGPKIIDLDGSIYPSARTKPSIKVAIGHALLGLFKPNNKYSRKYKNLDLDPNQTRNSDWLSGAAQFIRKKALDDVGGWNEIFFMYCEDIELGDRLIQRGWKNVYYPKAQITHVQGASSSKVKYFTTIEHHKSLYKYTKIRYESNFVMKTIIILFIGIRLPISLLYKLFRIN